MKKYKKKFIRLYGVDRERYGEKYQKNKRKTTEKLVIALYRAKDN